MISKSKSSKRKNGAKNIYGMADIQKMAKERLFLGQSNHNFATKNIKKNNFFSGTDMSGNMSKKSSIGRIFSNF